MHALELVGLRERATDVVATFSGGMQRRLNLACALLHRPAVLLLDEPTVGVDPQSLARILETVRDQARGGTAVLYSTHHMDEAERLCDHVVLIDHGRVVASGTPAELTRSADGGVRLVVVTREPLPDGWLAGVEGARALSAASLASARGQRHEIAIDALSLTARVLELAAAETEVLELHVQRPDLRDVFLHLTGRDLRD
jgi:ABC-2 type transport system ATP-binding protein